MYNSRHFYSSSVSKCTTVATFSLPVSQSVQLSPLSVCHCLKVCNSRHFQSSTVAKSRTVATFSRPLSQSVQLSLLSVFHWLLCLLWCSFGETRIFVNSQLNRSLSDQLQGAPSLETWAVTKRRTLATFTSFHCLQVSMSPSVELSSLLFFPCLQV